MSEPFNALCQGRYGPMLYNKNDIWMGRAFECYGEFSEIEARTICAALRPGMIAIDAGANIGALTIPMALAVGEKGAVFAFEPQRYVYYVLVANVALNSLTNVRPVLGALGNAKGAIDVPQLDPTLESSSFVGVSLAADRPKLLNLRSDKVPVMPLDDLNLVHVDFIKADVEGMELDVLKGGADTIAAYRPVLYLEADKAEQIKGLLAWLNDHDYECYWDNPPMFNPANVRGRKDNVFSDDEGRQVVSTNWLCVPAERHIEVQGSDRVTEDALYRVDDAHPECVRAPIEQPTSLTTSTNDVTGITVDG